MLLVAETVLQFDLEVIGESIAKGGVHPRYVIAPRYAPAVVVANRAEQMLIPAKSSEQLWSDLVFRFHVIGNTVGIADLRNFKARLKSFGLDLPVMPLETDILAEKQFTIVADVLARRKARTGDWKQVCTAAG